MATQIHTKSLLTSDLPENDENVSPNFIKTQPNMKTLPNSIQNIHSFFSAPHKDRNSSSGEKGPNMSTRSPIRTAKRRGLATLQPSTSGKGSVVGGQREDNIFTDLQKKKKSGNVFSWTVKQDTPPKKGSTPLKKTESISTQTDFDEWLSLADIPEKDSLAEEAVQLLRSESSSKEDYFKEIAEERRLALEETLKENEELCDEVDSLKAKCEKLEQALSEAENYKLLYISMLESSKNS